MRPARAIGRIGIALALVAGCEGARPSDVAEPRSQPPSELVETSPSSDPVRAAPTTAKSPTEPPAWALLGEVDHWLPGPAARKHRFDPARASLDRQCQSCHLDVAHEWAGSQHATSFSSRAFQRAFTAEPLPFCQSCHAPETSPKDPVPEAAAAMGVACVTCHVEPGSEVVWAAGEPGANDKAPHPLARSVAFAGPQACGGCHEFGFPDQSLRSRPLAMQSTLTEHETSQASMRSCADCHMPTLADDAGGHRSHAFPGAYDKDMLARSLEIEVERIDAAQVRLRLRPGDVGHAVPTGDLLRRLDVALIEVDERGSDRVLDRRWLGREFATRAQDNGLMLRDQVSDTRVGIGESSEREVILRVPTHARTRALQWRITHQRVAHAGSDPRSAAIEGQLELARGSVGTWTESN